MIASLTAPVRSAHAPAQASGLDAPARGARTLRFAPLTLAATAQTGGLPERGSSMDLSAARSVSEPKREHSEPEH